MNLLAPPVPSDLGADVSSTFLFAARGYAQVVWHHAVLHFDKIIEVTVVGVLFLGTAPKLTMFKICDLGLNSAKSACLVAYGSMHLTTHSSKSGHISTNHAGIHHRVVVATDTRIDRV